MNSLCAGFAGLPFPVVDLQPVCDCSDCLESLFFDESEDAEDEDAEDEDEKQTDVSVLKCKRLIFLV